MGKKGKKEYDLIKDQPEKESNEEKFKLTKDDPDVENVKLIVEDDTNPERGVEDTNTVEDQPQEQAEETPVEEPEEPVEEPEVTEEDTEEQADEALYTIKVGEEKKQVTMDELVEYAQKGKDYTKKTQDLAEQRKALGKIGQIIEKNPALAEDFLTMFGDDEVDYTDSRTPVEEEPPEAKKPEQEEPETEEEPETPQPPEEETEMTPHEREILERQIDLDLKEVRHLADKYGVNFMEGELLEYAMEQNMPDLKTAFNNLYIDEIRAAAAAETTNAAFEAYGKAKKTHRPKGRRVSKTPEEKSIKDYNIIKE